MDKRKKIICWKPYEWRTSAGMSMGLSGRISDQTFRPPMNFCKGKDLKGIQQVRIFHLGAGRTIPPFPMCKRTSLKPEEVQKLDHTLRAFSVERSIRMRAFWDPIGRWNLSNGKEQHLSCSNCKRVCHTSLHHLSHSTSKTSLGQLLNYLVAGREEQYPLPLQSGVDR